MGNKFVEGSFDIIKSKDWFDEIDEVGLIRLQYKNKSGLSDEYYDCTYIIAFEMYEVSIEISKKQFEEIFHIYNNKKEYIYEDLEKYFIQNFENNPSFICDGYIMGEYWEDYRNRIDIHQSNYYTSQIDVLTKTLSVMKFLSAFYELEHKSKVDKVIDSFLLEQNHPAIFKKKLEREVLNKEQLKKKVSKI